MSSEIRQYIAEAIDSGNWKRAFSLAGELWRTQPFTSTASYLISLQPRFEANVPFWQKSRVAVLRSFTVEPVIPLFRAEVQQIESIIQLSDKQTAKIAWSGFEHISIAFCRVELRSQN